MSSLKTTALQVIKKYPEVFSALEEFERTKKIPKFTYRRRIDVTIDEHLLKKFRNYCRQHNMVMSRIIEEMMKNKLKSS